MFVYAGNAALFLGMAVFPLIIMLLSLLKYIPMLGPEQLRNTVLELFPAVPEISMTVSSIAAELERESTATVSWIAGLAALFSASTGVFAIMKGLARINRIKHQSLVKYRLIALGYTVALLLLIILTLGTELGAKLAVRLLKSRLEAPALTDLADAVIPVLKYFKIFITLAAFLTAVGLYSFPFKQKKKPKDLIPGAVFAVVGWFLSTKLFAFFIAWFWKPSVLYGSLTAIVLIALWGFIIMSVLFMGAALNRAAASVK